MLRMPIDVRTKSAGFIWLLAMTFFFNDPGYLVVFFLLSCLLACLVRLSWRKAFRFILPLWPLLLLMLVCAAFDTSRAGFTSVTSKRVLWSWGRDGFQLTWGNLGLGLTYVFRILTFMLLSMVIRQDTSQAELLQLCQWLKLPGEISFLILTALRFIPALDKKRLQITEAQAARGSTSHEPGLFRTVRSFIPIVIPLFAGSIQMADTLAVAMVSRGFGAPKKQTANDLPALGLQDYLLLLAVMILSLIAVYVRFGKKWGAL